ncbi:MAG: hypothetical protein HON43_03075 [Alphaproteobacteria bacterium]|nr:hypothetical protein [Alphaproteobacteria bacterium]MBT5390014.1 hypothetical protein [Alphaproteobacteria bacterium]
MTLACTLCVHHACARIIVSPLRTQFKLKDKPYQDISVFNQQKDKKSYVGTTLKLIENPGMPNERSIESRNPKEVGLLLTPPKLVLAPNQRRSIRVSLLKPPGEQERIYRIKVMPVLGQLKRVAPVSQGEKRLFLRVNVAFLVELVIPPIKPVAKISAIRNGKSVTVKNIGNTNLLFGKIQQCTSADKCVETGVTGKRLYAGNTYTFEIPEAGPVSFETVAETLDKKSAGQTN